jgi:Bacterial Ig domain
LKSTAKVVVQVADRPKLAPIATNDAIISVGGARVSLDPLTNDSDPDGEASALIVKSAAAESDSVMVAVAPHLVTIQPPSTPGNYRVSYVVADPDGLTATGVITVTVQSPPNQPPVAVADAVETNFGTTVSIPVLSNDSDPDGGQLTIQEFSQGEPSGTVTKANASNLRYAPAPGFSGTARFTYTISDPQGATSTATVTVTVNGCSAAAPSLSDDAAGTKLNNAVSIDLFANDATHAGTFAVLPAIPGSVTQTGPGQVLYTPPPNFSGRAQFAYTVTNSCGVVATASVTVTVNHPPTASNDSAQVTAGQSVSIPVLANDGDPDGDPITIIGVSNVSGGTASFTGTDVTFTANKGAPSGSFSYTISDHVLGGLTASASVAVTIVAANNPPKAKDDNASTLVGVTINSIDVLSNDSDPDGDTLTITSVGATTGGGSVSLNGSTISFTPGASAVNDSFSYTISDGKGGTDTAVVRVKVTTPIINQPPQANGDSCSGALTDVTVACDVLSNDTDPENDPLSIVGASVTAGSASVSWAGSQMIVTVTTPGPQTITISYTISDGRGNTATGTAGVTIA